MKVYQTSEIRNLALIGGAKAGKTSVAEAMLFQGGVITRRGSVDDKNSVSDYKEIELERQNSVSSTVLYAEYQGTKINFIDCPGFDDYIGEVISSLKVADTSIMVVNAQTGVDVGTEIDFRWTKKMNKPLVFAINQLDHEKANYDETINQLKSFFGNNITIIQYPINVGTEFEGVIDILKMKMLKFAPNGAKVQEVEIPSTELDKAKELQALLMENAASYDDNLMENFFENGTLTDEELNKGLKLGITTRGIFPVLCVSAKKDQGINRLMEFIVLNTPAPNEVEGVKTENGKILKCNPSDPTSLFIFKTSIEQHLGEMSIFKVYSGEVTEAIDLVNPNTSSKERLSQLMCIAGKTREKVEKLVAGDIGATIKLKNTNTQNTLNTPKNADDIIEYTQYPNPKFRTAIKAKNTADDEKLGALLSDLRKQDLTLTVEYSKELKQIILSGQGEQHINVAKWYIEKLNKIEVVLYSPKIPYRETITKDAEAMYRHKKQSGGAGQFGEVHMLIEPWFEGKPNQTKHPVRGSEQYPLSWGGKLIYNNCIVGGAIDARFMPAILKGIMEKIEEGPLTGSYARDIVVNIYDGKMHPVDSNEMAFKLAGRNAFREAFKNAGPKILEPIYDLEVTMPADRMGDCMTDLQSRRAVVMGMDSDGAYQIIKAKVPLAEMNKYSTSLSSITSGRGSYNMTFSEYQQVPADVQQALLKAYEEQEKEDE